MKKISKAYTCISCLFLLLLGNGYNSFAQIPKIPFEKYGVAEGLPEEVVADVIQDDKGFIWCTTQNGLVKYDGYKFKVYKAVTDKKDTTSLQFNMVAGTILKGRDGKIWIGSGGAYGGIASFDPRTEKFRTFYPGIDETKKIFSRSSSSYLLLEDFEGNIWFRNITDLVHKIICRLNPKTGFIKIYPVHEIENKSFPKLNGTVESSNEIWLLDEQGNLNKWNREKDTFEIAIPAGTTFSSPGKTDTIRFLMKGRDNHLLLTGAHGLYVFDSKNIRLIKQYTTNNGTENGLSDKQIIYATEDLNGQFWVFHEGGIISLVNQSQNSITLFTYGSGPLYYDKGPKESSFFFVSAQNKNGIWFQSLSARQGPIKLKPDFFMHYDFATKKFSFYDYKFNVENNPLVNWANLYGFFEDRSGLLWLNTRPGLYKQSPKKRQMELFRHLSDDPNSLPDDIINNLFEDKKHRLWIGTQNGLAYYQPDQDNFRVFKNDPANTSSLSANFITNISEDADGKIWVATGNGLNQWQESTSSFKRFFPNSFCFSGIDHQDRLLLIIVNPPKKGVFLLDHKTGSILKSYVPDPKNPASFNGQISYFFQDSKENIWLGTSGMGLYRLNEKADGFIHYQNIPGDSTSISHNDIVFMVEDEKKRLWIGTINGLNLYNEEQDQFSRYRDINTGSMAGYAKDKNGKLWFTTYAGGGILTIDVESGNITTYGEEKGFLHTDIRQDILTKEMATDDYGKFWLPNERGLSVFDPENKSFTNYFVRDGFQQYNRWYNGIRTSNGDIWIGGDKGLNHIVPADLLKKDSSLATVVITKMNIQDSSFSLPDSNIFNNTVAYTDTVRLTYWQKDLGFEFIALHYLRSEDNQYSWKMENYDANWSTPSLQRTAKYTNLPPGTYIFRVRAANADGIWNEKGASITIFISPPFWQTWWFRLLMGIFLLAVLYGIYRWRTATLRKQKRILEQTVVERTAEVVAEKVEVEKQKAKSDELLLNILPHEVAEELKEKGYTTAKSFDEVTILFSDITGFTHVTEKLTAQELVKEIDTYFSAFDRIMQRLGLEKIKTIGDAYIAAGGLPQENKANVYHVIEAALAMQQAVETFKQERIEKNIPYFELRIGIHTGPVVAGVVGIKKFQYDIWGDTVNMAARMEQSGEPGKINISQYTFENIKDQYTCVYRGKVEAKNKGSVDMYFVEGKK
ncbi:MAG: adenylate/guanylate cyclase domain-containing protein [Saprospiraceae bacterium]